MTFLKYIIRYPIKGFNGEFMNTANLHPGSTISGDRKYAFAKFEIFNSFFFSDINFRESQNLKF